MFWPTVASPASIFAFLSFFSVTFTDLISRYFLWLHGKLLWTINASGTSFSPGNFGTDRLQRFPKCFFWYENRFFEVLRIKIAFSSGLSEAGAGRRQTRECIEREMVFSCWSSVLAEEKVSIEHKKRALRLRVSLAAHPCEQNEKQTAEFFFPDPHKVIGATALVNRAKCSWLGIENRKKFHFLVYFGLNSDIVWTLLLLHVISTIERMLNKKSLKIAQWHWNPPCWPMCTFSGRWGWQSVWQDELAKEKDDHCLWSMIWPGQRRFLNFCQTWKKGASLLGHKIIAIFRISPNKNMKRQYTARATSCCLIHLFLSHICQVQYVAGWERCVLQNNWEAREV